MQQIRIFFEASGKPKVFPASARVRPMEPIVWLIESFNNANVKDVTITFSDVAATLIKDPNSLAYQTSAMVTLETRLADPEDLLSAMGDGVLVGRALKAGKWPAAYKYKITSSDGLGMNGPELDPKIIIDEP